MNPTVSVVSMLVADPTAVRGERTRRVVRKLRAVTQVDVIPDPTLDVWDLSNRSLLGKVWGRLSSFFLLDPYEMRSRKVMWRRPVGDGAYVVAYPFSAAYIAARKAWCKDVPYVVDVGDPWVLTAQRIDLPPAVRWRARRAESFLFRHARGAIFTTAEQGERMKSIFPELSVLVRPNGTTRGIAPRSPSPRVGGGLRLVHYGSLYNSRLDVSRLLKEGFPVNEWDTLEFHQYGPVTPDLRSSLDKLQDIRVYYHDAVPWHTAQYSCSDYDAAVVIGNEDSSQLPSKALSYLSLGIPRIALVGRQVDGALASFVDGSPGWLTVHDRTKAGEIRDFLDTVHLEVEVPEIHLWDNVAEEIVDWSLSKLLRPGTTFG